MSEQKYCCNQFKEGIEEGIYFYSVYSGKYEIDWYDLKGDYTLNYCPNCGTKVNKEE